MAKIMRYSSSPILVYSFPRPLVSCNLIFNQRPTVPLRLILINILTECRSLIQYASLDTFKAKIGRLFTPQSTQCDF